MVNSTAWGGVVATALCVCMLICFAGGVGSGAAADGEKSVLKTMMAVAREEGTCGENLRWFYSENTLTINGTGEMKDYSSQTPWYAFASKITAIIIEDGVTSIGSYAFFRSTKVNNVTIPGSVKTIGDHAFDNCVNLESLIISDGVTSIGNYTFFKTGVKSVTIPGSMITIGEFAFHNCLSLDSLIISDGVPSIGNYAFQYSGLKNVAIPGSVKTIGEGAFSACYQLESVIISYGVTSIGKSAFLHSGLKNVTIPGSVQIIGEGAFQSCGNLESAIISYGVTSIEKYAFSSSGVKNVTIPGSVKTIGDYAFQSCGNLESVIIPDGVKTIGQGAFQSCNRLETVIISDGVTSIGNSAFYCPLSTVFYQGIHDLLSEDVFNKSAVDTMCVPQDYNSSTFCGVDVTSDKDICQQFQNMFSYCSKPAFINGDLMREDKYKTSNECVMIQCNDEAETVSAWSLCNRTSNEEHICVEEECIDDEGTIDKTVIIRIKLEGAMKVKDIVMEQNINVDDDLRRIMNNSCGIEEMMIGWQTDEEGSINEFVIYVDDEEVFKSRSTISGQIKEQWNSILPPLYPKAKDVKITRKHVCLDEECKKDVYVDMELEHSIDLDEFDVDVIIEVLKEEIGIDTSGILIGWDSDPDESERIIRVIIYVDDEATASSIADSINNRKC